MKTYRSLIAASLMLAALVPIKTHAAVNTWLNTSTDFLWNTSSANWTSPTVWADGNDAIFGTNGAGTVTLGTAITAHNVTVSAGDYTFTAPGGSTLTLGGTTPTITVGSSNVNLGVSLQGTAGLTVQGASPTNKLTLAGNNVFGQGNNYTGGTFVKSGTVVMNADNANGTSQYAIDSIEALDTGATVKFFNATDGVNNIRVNANGQIQRGASPYPGKRINMTGGTFDTAGDDNRNQVPIVQGTGTILNSSDYSRAVLKMVAGAGTFTFSGIIADGGPVTNSIVSGKVAHRLDIDCQDFQPGTVWILTGANTYSGSLRITGGTLKLSGAGRMGMPQNYSPPNRINDGGHIDLNGTSQLTQMLVSSGTDGQDNLLGQVYNSAPGTVSTYTVGTADVGSQSWSGKFLDNLDNNAGGGVLALTKVGTNTQQIAGGLHTYSGPTTINNGTLNIGAAASVAFAAPSPNSAIYINSPGLLGLSYTGSARPVTELYLNGVPQTNGIYDATTSPGFIVGTGSIQVTASPNPNMWLNTSTDFLWNTTSVNWTSPTIWANGTNAFFGTTGAGTVTLGAAITAHNITVNAGDYIFNAPGGSTLTLSGTTPTIRVGSSNVILGVSLQGTAGLTVQGTTATNKLTLAANTAFGQGNNYTGGTYVRSGTLEMNAAPVNGSTQYAIDSIEAMDPGATVKFFNAFDGVNNVRVPSDGQMPINSGQRINMTGGTFDVCGDDNRNKIPVVQGTGTILNSSEYSRAVLKMFVPAGSYTFSGIIADGGPVTNSLVSGKVAHRLDIDVADGTGTFVMAGANTYSGSTRRGSAVLQLSGAGTMGIPTIATPAIGLRINGSDSDPVLVDLNGTSQRISGMGGNGGRLGNTAAATTSVLTVGKVDGSIDTGTPSWPGKLVDGGGILAITKVGTNTQAFAGTGNTYSGDTTVSNGILAFTTVTAVSPNTVIRLFTSQGTLALSYAGTAPVKGLAINGVQMPNGIYGSSTPPIASTGFIQVAGSSVRPVLSSSVSGGSLTFSWPGGAGSFKLQSQTNALTVGISGNWSDYPGGGSNPVSVPVNPGNPTVFFRLAPAP